MAGIGGGASSTTLLSKVYVAMFPTTASVVLHVRGSPVAPVLNSSVLEHGTITLEYVSRHYYTGIQV